MTTPVGNLLCVANFHTNAGYAWNFIESLYAAVADDLAAVGVRTFVAYPTVDASPQSLIGSKAEAIELPFDLNSPRHLSRCVRAIRRHGIRTLYLSDQPSWHPAYAVFRAAGVKAIIVHDHTSGERTSPIGVRRFLKRLSRQFRPAMADEVLAVSDYVRRRKIDVDLIPGGRVRVMLNSVQIPETLDRTALRAMFSIAPERPIIMCACRAAEYKGVQYLLEAFNSLEHADPRPVLIHFGDGPYLDELRRIRDSLPAREDIILAGYRTNVAELLAGADVCVVPSIWQEAFGLAALEPAAYGVAVVATRVGGIPEVVVDRETGRLVPPRDSAALAEAIAELLADPLMRKQMAENGRLRAMARFSRQDQIVHLTRIIRKHAGLTQGLGQNGNA